MELYRNLFGTGFSRRSVLMLAFLGFFPNVLGMVVLQTPFGFKFHFFQILVFFAALAYGKWGGAVAGTTGSLFTAVALGNPFIVVGNGLLGFFTGLFAKRTNPVFAVTAAFLIQLPWLYFTDLLVGMPETAVQGVAVGLFFSNLVWAGVAWLLFKRIGKAFG